MIHQAWKFSRIWVVPALLVLAGILTSAKTGVSDQGNDCEVRLTIDKIRSVRGVLHIAFYDHKDKFMSDDVVRLLSIPVEQVGEQLVCVSDLAPGEYAVSAFHDANANGRLDKNALGVPVESFGFSNNARGVIGPPSFSDAKFSLRMDTSSIRISLRSM